MKCVFMAGGKGTRISSIISDIPKSMIKVGEKPILEHEIECLRNQGYFELIITVSHMGQIIMDYFGDGKKISPATHQSFGVHIEYYVEKEPLGNAGALFQLKEKLTEDFLLLNADVLFDVDIHRFVKRHKDSGALVTLFTHPNNHPYDSGLIVTDGEGRVVNWLTKEENRDGFYKNRVNAGLHILSPQVLNMYEGSTYMDLDRQVLKPLAGTGKMYVYDSPEYVKDMGTPERFRSVCRDYNLGIISRKNLRNKQRAIFLDRDGVVNKHVGFLTNIREFELLPDVARAIKKINGLGILTVIVTNQPVIARGEVTYSQLEDIHNKMEVLLGEEGAYIDAIYFCPHHPDRGYAGEITELKIDCDCRKPKIGMFIRAAADLNIDLGQSWMIGDGEKDIRAGNSAGCSTILISDKLADFGQNLTKKSLLDAINEIERLL